MFVAVDSKDEQLPLFVAGPPPFAFVFADFAVAIDDWSFFVDVLPPSGIYFEAHGLLFLLHSPSQQCTIPMYRDLST